jgi:hypothetical protein
VTLRKVAPARITAANFVRFLLTAGLQYDELELPDVELLRELPGRAFSTLVLANLGAPALELIDERCLTLATLQLDECDLSVARGLGLMRAAGRLAHLRTLRLTLEEEDDEQLAALARAVGPQVTISTPASRGQLR